MQCRSRDSRGHRAAFTLVEMLVVLAVIGILAGILLPALSAARRSARRTNCKSNLDQISKTLAIYCNNSDDYLPSYYAYGSVNAHIGPEASPLLQLYTGHQGASRHMVIASSEAYVTADLDTALAPGGVNFMPIGLGILVARQELQDPRVLDCPSMRSAVSTYYGDAEYQYDPTVWRKLGSDASRDFVNGDGTDLYTTDIDGTHSVTAILSSYSYRNTPFYCRSEPDNWSEHSGAAFSYVDDSTMTGTTLAGKPWVAAWDIKIPDSEKVVVRAEFMTPPFKTRRHLKDRAIVADTFDYAGADSPFGPEGGLVRRHHGNGYNVAFGDGHVIWYEDGSDQIRGWSEWYDPEDTGTAPWPDTDNLTISSHSSNYVWNVFDRTAGLDVQ